VIVLVPDGRSHTHIFCSVVSAKADFQSRNQQRKHKGIVLPADGIDFVGESSGKPKRHLPARLQELRRARKIRRDATLRQWAGQTGKPVFAVLLKGIVNELHVLALSAQRFPA
jgi:hypothetical protein